MNADAVTNSIDGGITRHRDAGTFTSSANEPYAGTAMTRSPGAKLVTPSPTVFTTPANSLPGENGRAGFVWYLFSMLSTSGKFTLAAFTLTTTSPGPGTRSGTSSITRVSGGPKVLHSTAFTGTPIRPFSSTRVLPGGL